MVGLLPILSSLPHDYVDLTYSLMASASTSDLPTVLPMADPIVSFLPHGWNKPGMIYHLMALLVWNGYRLMKSRYPLRKEYKVLGLLQGNPGRAPSHPCRLPSSLTRSQESMVYVFCLWVDFIILMLFSQALQSNSQRSSCNWEFFTKCSQPNA